MYEVLIGIMCGRQVRVLIIKMEFLGLLQHEGEKRCIRHLQTERNYSDILMLKTVSNALNALIF